MVADTEHLLNRWILHASPREHREPSEQEVLSPFYRCENWDGDDFNILLMFTRETNVLFS